MAGRPARATVRRDTPERPGFPAPEIPILTIAEVAGFLRVSRDTAEPFLHRDGLPYIDLGTHRPRHGRKRADLDLVAGRWPRQGPDYRRQFLALVYLVFASTMVCRCTLLGLPAPWNLCPC